MDAILPDVQRPPTMTHTSNLDVTHGLLTDRFGFIFDQRQQKRRSLGVKGTHQKKLSGVQTLGNFRKDSDENVNGSGMSPLERPNTPQSIEEDSKKSWQDYLKIPTNIGRPSRVTVAYTLCRCNCHSQHCGRYDHPAIRPPQHIHRSCGQVGT